MPFKTIMTHVEPDWGSSRALDAAVQLCGLFDAHLTGVGAENFDPMAYAYAGGDIVQVLRDQIDTDLAAAQKRFAAAGAGVAGGSTWLWEIAFPAEAIARCASGADLVVARRRAEHESASNLCAADDLVTACGAPVLVAPHGDAPLRGDCVLVAWRDSSEARRAVADALPFLQRAKEVVLVQVIPAKEAPAAAGGVEAVLQRLKRHGVAARAEVVEPVYVRLGLDLAHAADRLGADLIVTGAYSHLRLREWVFGGVTSDLLEACSKYVLFSH